MICMLFQADRQRQPIVTAHVILRYCRAALLVFRFSCASIPLNPMQPHACARTWLSRSVRRHKSQPQACAHTHHQLNLPCAFTHQLQSCGCKSTCVAWNGNTRPYTAPGARCGAAEHTGSVSITCSTPWVPRTLRASQPAPGAASITATRVPETHGGQLPRSHPRLFTP